VCTGLSGEPIVGRANGRPRDPRGTRGRANGREGSTGLSGVHRTVSGAPTAPKRQRLASPNKEGDPHLSAFRDRGVPEPTSECRRVPQPRWVEREGEREGGKARRPETGAREVGIPRPSCSSRAQVGCACSRGLQASTRERERAASSERLSRPRPRAADPP
jgi:hypothetical protein